MMEILNEQIKLIKNNRDLLQESARLELPTEYVALLIPKYQNERKKLQDTYKKYISYLDKDFAKELRIKENFSSRIWELFIYCYLDEKNIHISPRKKEEPDTLVNNGNGGDKIWIEAKAFKIGHKIPKMKLNNIPQILKTPQKLISERIENKISEALIQLRERLSKGIIKKEDFYFIAINTEDFGYRNHFHNNIDQLFADNQELDGIIFSESNIFDLLDKNDINIKLNPNKKSISYIIDFLKEHHVGNIL